MSLIFLPGKSGSVNIIILYFFEYSFIVFIVFFEISEPLVMIKSIGSRNVSRNKTSLFPSTTITASIGVLFFI